MRSSGRVLVAAVAAAGLFGIGRAADRPTPAGSLPTADSSARGPAALENQLQLGRRRIGQPGMAGASHESPSAPVAQAADAHVLPQSAAPGTGIPAQVAPPIPFRGPPGAAAIHERLRARRLARVQQMKQQAQQTGDSQGVERAQYLEGMVNELHNKGLFNFGQKVMGAMQEGKLQGLMGGAGGAAPATGSAEIPEADLGDASPLPNVELGTPAPLPTQGATEDPKADPAPEAGPQLPPSNAPGDGSDAPPAK